jgi:hypothetical protein
MSSRRIPRLAFDDDGALAGRRASVDPARPYDRGAFRSAFEISRFPLLILRPVRDRGAAPWFAAPLRRAGVEGRTGAAGHR